MRIGALFAGIGGLELGMLWGGLGELCWQVEMDEHCRAVLATRYPGLPRYIRVEHVGGYYVRPHVLDPVDLLIGGFPCQDVSSAGSGEGLEGERSGLWWEYARIIDELAPAWVVVENVTSGASRWVDDVRAALAERGYKSMFVPMGARDVGAPHRRNRVFIVAFHPEREAARLRRGGDGGAHVTLEHAGKLSDARARQLAELVFEAAAGGTLLASLVSSPQLGLWGAESAVVRSKDYAMPQIGAWDAPATEAFRARLGGMFAAVRDRAASALSLPTPSASEYGTSGNGCPGDGRESYAHKGTPSLHTLARRGELPTPRANEEPHRRSDGKDRRGEHLSVAMHRLFEGELLPTPTAGDAKASGSRRAEGSQAHPGVSLTDVVVHGRTVDGAQHGPRQAKGYLSPRFVEWMMGLPLGWTEPGGALSTGPGGDTWWLEPPVAGVLVGTSSALDRVRLKACGNAVVPQCAQVVAWVINLLREDFHADRPNPTLARP